MKFNCNKKYYAFILYLSLFAAMVNANSKWRSWNASQNSLPTGRSISDTNAETWLKPRSKGWQLCCSAGVRCSTNTINFWQVPLSVANGRTNNDDDTIRFFGDFPAVVQACLATGLLVRVIVGVIFALSESSISSFAISALHLVCLFALEGIVAAQKPKKRIVVQI